MAKEVLHCIRKTEECLNIVKELLPMYQKRGLLQRYGVDIYQISPFHLRLEEAMRTAVMINTLEDERSSSEDIIYATHQLQFMSITGKPVGRTA